LPATLKDTAHRNVSASVNDPTEIAGSIDGADAVVSAVGSRQGRRPTVVCQTTMASIMSAMHDVGCRRVLAISASAAFPGGDLLSRLVIKPILRRLLRHPPADLVAMEQIVTSSLLDWTVVRAPRLTQGRPTGSLRQCVEGTVPFGFTARRADVARFLLDHLLDSRTYRRVISVAN
jgi:putative NADH-flavin reductase